MASSLLVCVFWIFTLKSSSSLLYLLSVATVSLIVRQVEVRDLILGIIGSSLSSSSSSSEVGINSGVGVGVISGVGVTSGVGVGVTSGVGVGVT